MADQNEIADLLKSGNVTAAMETAKNAVRAAPAAVEPRILMFQMMALVGEWDRALTQLKVVSDLDPTSEPMVAAYRALIHSEAVRADVFAGRVTPVVFGEPEGWVAALLEALRLEGTGAAAAAATLRDKAFEDAPASVGRVVEAAGEETFAWIADCDPRLGPVLEAVVNGRYMWVPFSVVAALEAEPPVDLRDFVWFPVQITLTNGGQMVAFVPSRYPGTPQVGDGNLLLARRTDWVEQPDGGTVGLGQRMLATDQGEHALFDIRHISLGDAGTVGTGGTVDEAEAGKRG